ncbi:NAD(P)-dependent alcohol dehydrogenase, partial [Aliarcobacter butzleri]
GSGEFVKMPRLAWGNGMAHNTMVGGLMPGGRLRIEKLVPLIQSKRIKPKKLITHTLNGMEHIEEALLLMKD